MLLIGFYVLPRNRLASYIDQAQIGKFFFSIQATDEVAIDSGDKPAHGDFFPDQPSAQVIHPFFQEIESKQSRTVEQSSKHVLRRSTETKGIEKRQAVLRTNAE